MSEQASPTSTNSIDAVWPPAASAHNRIRGFYDEGVVRTQAEVAQFGELFEACVTQLVADPESDRLSVRLIASTDAVALLSNAGLRVEGAIPFTHDGEELALTYTGWNQPNRTMSGFDLQRHRALLSRMVQTDRDTTDPVVQLEAKGYTPHLIKSDTPAAQRAGLVDRLTDLYAVFGYDKAAVSALLRNPSNVIAYIEDGPTIISTLMAEEATVDIDGLRPLSLVEITEGVTRPEYRGKGLFKATYGYLIDTILAERGQGDRTIDVLYSESNLAMEGLLMAAHKIGRRYNHFDAERFGLQTPDFGIMPQSFSVRDGVETRAYNDFAISYTPLR